jgi:hypothetical protein
MGKPEMPAVCSMPSLRGQAVYKKDTLEDLRPADLNFDGNADEYHTVSKRVIKVCGEFEEKDIISFITNEYGKYLRTEGSNTFVGSTWRATYKVQDGYTLLVTRYVDTVFSKGAETIFSIKHLKKSAKVGDPIKLADGKDYIIQFFNLADAVSWDGKKMTVDYDKVKIKVLSVDDIRESRQIMELAKSGLVDQETLQKKMEEFKEKAKEGTKSISFKDVKSVSGRKSFPDIYASAK